MERVVEFPRHLSTPNGRASRSSCGRMITSLGSSSSGATPRVSVSVCCVRVWKVAARVLYENASPLIFARLPPAGIVKGRWLHHTSFLWDFQPRHMDYLKVNADASLLPVSFPVQSRWLFRRVVDSQINHGVRAWPVI